ncbi:MAG: deoxyribose-phosphate aldolase [Gammaproteobacteria bacterium]|nr:deoxyribose-phosphate aldolase [Gammaproteobacteria bacterium]MBU1489440.1 deoxyribose-phosphate aldolase [Gammaproteobacteria bacterium]MBU2066698.1 deoxyribose-phosphate aldolase [Gammaproteobacteria bacterium]MBU2137611.1 deoxyribose-phosphate aldolase [Gammaproteobacteria bacterium]MBU2217272.1 deoxyribose-phosphate aldolase [Gammaproteobacteria bacterium]
MTADQTLAQQAVALLDLTSLNADDNEARIIALCQRALSPAGPVAAVCVYPAFVALARRTLDELGGAAVRVATVTNFPAGAADVEAATAQTAAAVAAGADEVDVVYPYRALLAGDAAVGRALVAACRAACGSRVLLKVILETGELQDPALIRQASLDAIDAGADFIKTSTGKVAVNATAEAAQIMLAAIAERGAQVGFKPAGGIRTLADARLYIDLAGEILGADWVTPAHLRLGASSLLDDLLATLGQAAAAGHHSGY